jgi:SAM-dependent methyltransferase
MAPGCPLCAARCHRRILGGDDWHLLRCRACGLYFRDPVPSETMRRHYDTVYDDDDTSEHIDERRRTLFSAFLDGFPPARRGRLLDVGCGSGEFLGLARERGWQVEGVEVSARGAALAGARGLTVHPAVEDLKDESYDLVTLWNVVDFFPRPLAQMRDIRRVLVPGGTVFLRAPNAVYQLAAWRLSRLALWPPALARLAQEAFFFQPLVWSPRTLDRLLAAAGFDNVRLWNSEVSRGDPYHGGSSNREQLVTAIKHGLRALAQTVALGTGGRVLVGSSLSALAQRP